MRTPALLHVALCVLPLACSDDAPTNTTSNTAGPAAGSMGVTGTDGVAATNNANTTGVSGTAQATSTNSASIGSTASTSESAASSTGTNSTSGVGGATGSSATAQTATATTMGGGGATTSTGTTGGGTLASSVCPVGSESMAPDLSGTPTRVEGIPPNDGYGLFATEGPVWIDGALYMSQIASGQSPPPARILKYTPGVGVEIWKDDVGTNGLAIDTGGVLYGATHKDGSISSFDLNNPAAAPVPVVSQYMGTRFSSPNDLAISSNGRVYFSDPSYQAGSERQPEERAYWFELADPSVINVIPNSPSQPNGISLSPDEQTLYVAGSSGTFAYPLNADGSPGTEMNFGPGGIDGMGLDCAGNVYLSSHGAGEVLVIGPDGMSLGSVSIGVSGVTNVAFGGPDRTTLYITRLDSNEPGLYEVNVGIAGLPY